MWSIFVLGFLAIGAILVQYACMHKVYLLVPRLGVRGKGRENGADGYDDGDKSGKTDCNRIDENTNMNSNHSENDGNNSISSMEKLKQQQDEKNTPPNKTYFSCCNYHATEVKAYFSQSISYGGVSLALLYMNVISIGGIMTSYLLSKGLRLDLLGIWRGVASIVGMVGTVTYRFSSNRTSLKNTAMWSICYFLGWVSICYCALLFLQDDYNNDDNGSVKSNSDIIGINNEKDENDTNTIALSTLIVGTCMSRIGLWTFDMSISQMMQELVSEDVRCAVGGTQNGLESSFYMLQFGLGMVFPDPEQFQILVGFCYSAVVLSFFLVWFGVYRNDRIRI